MNSTAVLEWKDILGEEKSKPYFQKIMSFLDQERHAGKNIYPPQNDIFNALKHTPFDKVEVVIIGQDPYHGPNQAHGLSFSVKTGIKPPPSLKNIYKELHTDVGFTIPNHGCLMHWAEQGVLLLNTVLSVEANQPQSHSQIGWQTFTDTIIKKLNSHPRPIVYLLWGSHAQQKETLIDQNKHRILKAPHPSPFSANRGFFGFQHFSKTNALLSSFGRKPIDWQV
jgi:uracil-DNA glycosylase